MMQFEIVDQDRGIPSLYSDTIGLYLEYGYKNGQVLLCAGCGDLHQSLLLFSPSGVARFSFVSRGLGLPMDGDTFQIDDSAAGSHPFSESALAGDGPYGPFAIEGKNKRNHPTYSTKLWLRREEGVIRLMAVRGPYTQRLMTFWPSGIKRVGYIDAAGINLPGHGQTFRIDGLDGPESEKGIDPCVSEHTSAPLPYFEDPDSPLPEDVNWIAIDEDGETWGYDNKPVLSSDSTAWGSSNSLVISGAIIQLSSEPMYDADCEQSLRHVVRQGEPEWRCLDNPHIHLAGDDSTKVTVYSSDELTSLSAEELDSHDSRLRDRFAGLALQGILARNFNHGGGPEGIARDAYKYADAMIAERRRK